MIHALRFCGYVHDDAVWIWSLASGNTMVAKAVRARQHNGQQHRPNVPVQAVAPVDAFMDTSCPWWMRPLEQGVSVDTPINDDAVCPGCDDVQICRHEHKAAVPPST
jgi:hypothetical protein